MSCQLKSALSTLAIAVFVAGSLHINEASAKGSSVLDLNYQNQEMKVLGGEEGKLFDLTPAENKVQLDKILAALEAHKTLTLRRYSSGGHSAVTVQGPLALESAIDGMLIMHWDRDNVMQALAEYQLARDKELRLKFNVPKDAWFHGLLASLKHHYEYDRRFVDIIDGKFKPRDYSARPHIRYNPISLKEVQDPWGHAQNDALGYLLFMTFYAANQGKLHVADRAWTESPVGKDPQLVVGQREAYRLGVLVPLLFEKIEVWQDFDFGAWEDKKAEHASSIGCALAGLREEKRYVDKFGPLTERIYGKEYKVTSDDLARIIKKCEESLARILPNEFINSDIEDKRADASKDRKADAALINALFLGAVSGQPLVSDAMTEKILTETVTELGRPIGIARYRFDIWDGRVDRKDLLNNEEAQWSHVAPMISVIYADLYQRTKKKLFLEQQIFFFQRGLTAVNKRWCIPEAYILDAKSRKWVSDANEPLAWAQAAEIMSIIAMKRSLGIVNK